MEKEQRLREIQESDNSIDPSVKDVVYEAGDWAKKALSGMIYCILIALGFLGLGSVLVSTIYFANLAIKAPLLSVIVVCFILWYLLLKFSKNILGRFEKKYE